MINANKVHNVVNHIDEPCQGSRGENRIRLRACLFVPPFHLVAEGVVHTTRREDFPNHIQAIGYPTVLILAIV